MEEMMTQTEETPATETTEETLNEQEAEDFEAAFDDVEETPEKEPAKEESEPEKEPTKEEIALMVGEHKFTAADVEGLLGRITELQGAANTPPQERQLLERLAAQSGMEVSEFMENVEGALTESKITQRMTQLLDQGMEEDMARHVAELEVQAKAAENMQKTAQNQFETAKTAEQATEETFKNQIKEFEQMFPDVGMPPDEVFSIIEKTGVSPVVAYQQYLLEQNKVELANAKQEQKNRTQTPGSVKGREAPNPDPFAAGFDSEI